MASVAQHSREMIKKGSRSFSAAAALFDPEKRVDVEMLYSWCRHCDDIIDGQELGFSVRSAVDERSPVERLTRLRDQTTSAHAGKPTRDPVFSAFQQVAQKYELPLKYPLDLLKGFEMDVAGRRYQSIDDTLEYCYHVAGVVGVMMAHIMGVRSPEVLDRASDLGLAFQLTNISRDIMDDASENRVYIPSDWLEEENLTRSNLADPRNREALFRVAQRMLAEAEKYYDSAVAGVPHLEIREAWAICTARNVYRRIGHKILKRGQSAWDTRTSTSGARKIYAVGSGLLQALWLKTPTTGTRFAAREGLWARPV